MDGELVCREIARGRLPGTAVVPVSKPTISHRGYVATERNNATVITGRVGEVTVEIMLDTGSTVSLLRHKEADSMNTHQSSQRCSSIQLVTASGEPLPIVSCVKASVQMTDDHF